MKQLPPFMLMTNIIQEYAWGSKSSIEALFGMPNRSLKPQAEIWMGAHPNGCSSVIVEDLTLRLDNVINQDKVNILGEKAQRCFNQLPFLFKVLAAEKALSIQVHPSKEAAEVGFAKENKAGIDLKAPNRNYKDPNHKPELIYALTPFQAMNGFCHYSVIIKAFEKVSIQVLESELEVLKNNQTQSGLRHFFNAILSLEGKRKENALNELMLHVKTHTQGATDVLIAELAKQYPGDIGLFAPLMLHVITLQPGEAMFLDDGTPHAYIKGTGLEIMANSDNVLRAGLTAKYIDVIEIIANTICVPKPDDKILIEANVIGNAKHYPIPVDDFKFSIYEGNAYIKCQSAEIIFAINENVILYHASGETLTLKQGQSAFIPFHAQQYSVKSTGTFARAYN
ncbi:MAG: mannose-6-phosphate isomerase, class I [Psychromonas sp.]|nr:mannose-6-phosphate isomerase, class I [Psychromonas sp.]